MDRNTLHAMFFCFFLVALRKESVDRNLVVVGFLTTLGGSLSARRAWIEILLDISSNWMYHVALRKESVDRNRLGVGHYRDDVSSLSARRAWIEISKYAL